MNNQPKTEGQASLITEPLGKQAHIVTEVLVLGEEKTQVGAHPNEQIVLKHGDTLLITDPTGNMPATQKETGLFWQGTRFLTNVSSG